MSNVPPPPPPPPPGPQGPQGSQPQTAQGGYGTPAHPPPAGGALSPTWNMTDPPPAGWVPKQKMVAGILGILLGAWGAHSFYLGNTKKGIIQLVVSIVTCGIGGIWGLIEGIQILTGSIKTDAYGVPMTE